MRDQLIGRVQNVAMRAVVLFELDEVLYIELPLECRHIADVRTAKCVDALIIIADGKYSSLVTGKQFQPFVLQIIRILKLVDQNMPERAAIPPCRQRWHGRHAAG